MDEAEALEAKLASALPGVTALAAAFLFGSHARGRPRADSDVDVALLLRPEGARANRNRWLRAAIIELAPAVRADRLDLIVLNDAPMALAFQVLKYGRVLFCADDVALHRFRVSVYRGHADFAHAERIFREATIRRATAQASRG